MELGIDILAMLFAAAFIAAFIDAIAGGGGQINYKRLVARCRQVFTFCVKERSIYPNFLLSYW